MVVTESAALDTRQLRAFVTLARLGSFTEAARKLHLSQSTVSHSIKSLETCLGCLLFDRDGKSVRLTSAGQALLDSAERIINEMMLAREGLARLEKWGRGRLRIGASLSMCQHLLPEVIPEFRRKSPHADFIIEPLDTPQAMQSIRNNQVDLGLALDPDRKDEFTFVPLFTDELQFALSTRHPWAVSGRVITHEIPRQDCFLSRKSSYTHRLVEEYFRKHGMVLNIVAEIGDVETIKNLVIANLGISIFAPWMARREMTSGQVAFLPLGSRPLNRTWGVFYPRGRTLTLHEETFVNLCRNAFMVLDTQHTRQNSIEPRHV